MTEKWYCPKCKDSIDPEYAVNENRCPFCNSRMIYPKPEEKPKEVFLFR